MTTGRKHMGVTIDNGQIHDEETNNIYPTDYLLNQQTNTPPVYPTAPPPYTQFDESFMMQPPIVPPPTYDNVNNNNQQDETPKEDLDFFRYTAPCKKIATCIATLCALVIFLVFILLIIYGKL